MRAYTAIKQRHPELPFGGYYALGVCNDVNAMIELKMHGEIVLVPLDARPAVLLGASINSPSACRWITGGMQEPDPRRILGSIPSMSRCFHCPP